MAQLKAQAFEAYLMEQYFKQENPLDDQSVEGFDEWLQDQDPNDMIDYAEQWKAAQ